MSPSSSPVLKNSAPISTLRNPKRRRNVSPVLDVVQPSPESPDSMTREIAVRRVGERSLTPYPPPMYSPRVTNGNRSVTPYPTLRRWPSRDAYRGLSTPSSLSSSPDKENEPFDRSAAPSPSPSPKKGKVDGEERGRTLSHANSCRSTDSRYTFGVPTNTPRSLSRSSSSSESSDSSKASQELGTSPILTRLLADRLFEIEIARRCKELTESPLADVTEAYTDKHDGVDILCPPNTPVTFEIRD